MKNSRGFYIFLGVSILFLTQRILASIKVTSVSDSIGTIVLMTLGIGYTVYVNRKNSFGKKLNIISSITFLMMCLGLSISSILIDSFPHFSDEHIILTLIIGSFGVVGFFAMLIILVWISNHYSKSKK